MTPEKRPSLREAAQRGMAAKAAAQQAAAQAPPGAPQPPVAAKPPAAKPPAQFHRKDTPPPPIVAYEDVIAACGHPAKFGLFENRLDRFRKDRRKKVTDRPCKECREKRRIEEEAALAKRKAEKELRKQQMELEQAKQPGGPKAANGGRLPDASAFAVRFDATKNEWSGTLTIPGVEPFSGSASGLFRLLEKLDRHYRQTLAPPPEAAPAAEAPPAQPEA